MAFFFDQLLFGAHARATSLGSWRKPVSEGTVDFDQFRGVSGEQVLAFKRLTMGPTSYHKSSEQKIYSKPIFKDSYDEFLGFDFDPSIQVFLPNLSIGPRVKERVADNQAYKIKSISDVSVRLEDVFVGTSQFSPENQLLTAFESSAYIDSIASSGEVLPYGVQAVWGGEDISVQGNAGTGSYAFVIDSGVLDTTGDLIVNKAWSRSWVAGESAFTDGDGHGTHVAGTIGALANGIGVVGVAPGAEIISLKVFDSFGGGATYSSIISAINYAADVVNNNNLDKSKVVINLSLGGVHSAALDAAVKKVADQGISFSIAAGNSGEDADEFSPASAGDHNNVYTVSAVNSNYRMSSWSNWDDTIGGDDVDLAAPGVGVLSYYQGGGLAYLSGTSMAAPHVAGALLMGGVEAGEMVTPNDSGYADPFALVVDSESPLEPEEPPLEPEEPPLEPEEPPLEPEEPPSEPEEPPVQDSNNDGLVDGLTDYYLFDDGEAVALTGKKGKLYSDSSSKNWDVIAARKDEFGYQVLREGNSKKEGKFSVWDVSESGKIVSSSGWRKADYAVQLDWETKFDLDLNADSIIGKPPIEDSNNDGLVDGLDDYYLFDDGEAVALTGKKGKLYSDSSSKNWDVIAARKDEFGYLVLREGDSKKEGKFSVWDVRDSGRIVGGSGWKTAQQADELGWIDAFSVDLHQAEFANHF